MKRMEVRITDTVDVRLDMMSEMFGMERTQVLLAAFAQYMPNIQPKSKPATTRKRRSKRVDSLGEGNKPKDKKEVVEYFRQRQVAEPLEPKAELFYDHYMSKGWVVGKSPVKHWGSCLTIWLRNNPEWRPVPSTKKETVSLNEFLEWAEDKRPPVFDKYRSAKSISDIDQLYIDEFADNQ
jgi:hypothetical protein